MRLGRFTDKVINKIQWNFINPMLANIRKKKLIITDFTAISNNCWGGRLYEYFNLPKQSPTVGLYFYAADYVNFCSNLKYYLSLDLKIITAEESKYRDDLFRKNEQSVFVGVLDDVELVFLHYHDKDIIKEKWQRRIERINWDEIILKFSFQNNCTDELIREFSRIPGYSKIILCGQPIDGVDDILVYPRSNGMETIDETENFDRWLKPAALINSKIKQK